MTHAMLTARARVLSNPGVDALRAWQTQADDAALASQPAAAQAGVLYGASLAANRLREADVARKQLDRLQKVVATDEEAALQARWLGVEIALAARDLPRTQVLALGDGIGMNRPDNAAMRRPELLLQAQIAMQAGVPEALSTAAQRLQTWVAAQPLDALAWQSLASIYAAQHQSLRALRAEAEARVAHLDYAGALDRLKGAQDRLRAAGGAAMSSADHIDASIIDTRLRQIEALLKEQALES
jgi:predicted Zn-dependent protease